MNSTATERYDDIAGTVANGGPGPRFEASPMPVIGAGIGARAASAVLREGAGGYVVAVAGPDGTELLPLGPFEESEVIATWRSLGAASGLTLAMVGPDGTREEAFPQVGRLRCDGALPRRRRGLPGGRRPRFLVRRKIGRLPLRPLVHRGEPEIAGGAI